MYITWFPSIAAEPCRGGVTISSSVLKEPCVVESTSSLANTSKVIGVSSAVVNKSSPFAGASCTGFTVTVIVSYEIRLSESVIFSLRSNTPLSFACDVIISERILSFAVVPIEISDDNTSGDAGSEFGSCSVILSISTNNELLSSSSSFISISITTDAVSSSKSVTSPTKSISISGISFTGVIVICTMSSAS